MHPRSLSNWLPLVWFLGLVYAKTQIDIEIHGDTHIAKSLVNT